MRIACLLLIAAAFFSAGCAPWIAHCGEDVSGLKTREQVHARFGEPMVQGVADGEPFEEYVTRRKIAEEMPLRCYGPGYGMSLIMTLGTIELITVRREFYLIGSRTLLGQMLRVTYNDSGAVAQIYLDGEPLIWFRESPQEP